MTAPPANVYLARFEKVFAYIDAHLSDELSVAQLSAVAAFSKYHFLRQFSDLFGIGVYQYVRLSRLKRASYQLAFRDNVSITEIALDSGYEHAESFARAFKKSVGQTPGAFRKQPQWSPWHDVYAPLAPLRSSMSTATPHPSVKLIEFPATRVAVLEHHGDPALIGDSIRRFIAWRKQQQLPPHRSATFNILYNDPQDTAPADFRLDLCVATDRDIETHTLGIISKWIPAGRCAVLRHIGSDETLRRSLAYLYAEWLPQSGEELRDFPLYLQRLRFYPDVPEHEAVVDIFLPVK